MTFVVDDGTRGTSERAWSRCPYLARVRRLAWPTDAGEVVVVSPHPDDETLALGGTLFALSARGRSVRVVAVTDGEGSHPRSPTTSPGEIAARRAGERAIALGHLGLERAPVTRLHVEDGRVVRSSVLVHSLLECLRGATLCFAPWRLDGHPDHEAAGHAAADACALLGVRLLEYPVWAWHWARAGSLDLPWQRARRVPLPPASRRAKYRAIDAYGSQIRPLSASPGDEPIVPEPVLAHFRRRFEVVLE